MTQLTDTERKFINDKNFVYVATINPDGSPQLAPLWAEVQDGLVWINTSLSTVKVRNLRRDPRVAVSTLDYEGDPYDSVSFAGKVVEITEEGAREHIHRLSHKYLGKPFPWSDKNRVILKIQKV